ncbi:alpha/beta fold hydrolase [Ferrovibrio sp.]|uniref:alpha/beta hydrolase n=1 Tax=Ferrovibrio sp. TaxID=1917215 RepID=UPI002629FD7C|nr:alpha/beta fold hydrolase [Ferrovibrio sp.]
MSHNRRRMLGLSLVALLSLTGLVRAEPIRLVQEGRGLDGELKLAGGKALRDGVMVLVHGTLAHNRMEIMQALQETLAERGLSTVAVTLSLGVSDRKGMYDCAVPHRHGNAQAAAEIAAWIDWAGKAGAAKIGLLGHSRGGAQVAWYAAQAGEKLPTALQKIVLAAPATFDRAAAPAEYKVRFGGDFNAIAAKAEALVSAGKGAELLTGTDFLYCPKTSVAAATFLDYHSGDGRNDTPSQLARINRPVLLAIAGADEVVKDLPQKLQSAKRAEKIRTITIDGADHFFKDLYGEDLADAIAKFWAE